jgi:SulP family sulfate permease
MIAGVLAAISTYAVQSITYLSPIRGTMCAATLRSSRFTRNPRANEILDDPLNGRQRIFVIQLQGHLFFGNMVRIFVASKAICHSQLVFILYSGEPYRRD